jgi:muconolactone D-isomerase
MEFLVEFDIKVPEGTPESEVAERERAEAAAAAKLEDAGHLVRVWKRPLPMGETTVLGLYRADTETELHALLSLLPLHEWMHVTVTPLEAHPNDPAAAHASAPAANQSRATSSPGRS